MSGIWPEGGLSNNNDREVSKEEKMGKRSYSLLLPFPLFRSF